jgi:hypothetical protein
VSRGANPSQRFGRRRANFRNRIRQDRGKPGNGRDAFRPDDAKGGDGLASNGGLFVAETRDQWLDCATRSGTAVLEYTRGCRADT